MRPAVDHDALAGDEPGAFGGQEADGVGDVARSSSPPGGHRGEIGLLDLIRDVGVALDGDETGRGGVHSDARRAQFPGPANELT